MSRLTDAELDAVERFNAAARVLTRTASNLVPGSAQLDLVAARVRLAVSTNPVELARMAGPYLMAYQEQITARSSDFFLTHLEAKIDPSFIEVFRTFAGKWPTLTEAERAAIWAKVQAMLAAALVLQARF